MSSKSGAKNPAASRKQPSAPAKTRAATEAQAAILNAIPAHLALLDEAGVILAVNETWRTFAPANRLVSASFGVGFSYLAACEADGGELSAEASELAQGLRRVLAGAQKEFALEYACGSVNSSTCFRAMVASLRVDGLAGAVVMHINVSGRKLSEDALQESEERFRSTFEQAAVGLAHVSIDGRFLRVNEKLCAILGYGRHELLGMTFGDLTVSEDREAGLNASRSMLAGEQRVYSTEKRYRRKSGDVVWVNLVTTLEQTRAGHPKFFISVFEDITLRREATDALKQSEREQRALAAQLAAAQAVAQVGSWVIELNILTVVWSAETHRIFGTDPDSFHPTHPAFLARVHPDDRAAVDAAFARSAGQPGMHTIEHRVLLPGGRIKFVEERWQVVAGAEGRPARAIGTCQDVSERKAAEAETRVSEERFRLLSKATNDAIWDWDLTSNALWWNDGFEGLFGFRRDEVEPTIESWYKRVHPEDRETIVADVHRAIDGGGASWTGEYRFLRKDGSHAFVLDRGYIIRDEAGKAVRMIGGMTDLSERRLLEVELRLQATRLRDSEEQYRLLFADSPQPMWVYDIETLRIVAVNSAAIAHYGYTEDEFLNLTILEIRPPEDVPALKARLANRPLPGTREEPYRHLKKDGTRIDVTITASPIEFNNRPARLVVTIDVTERLRAERNAERANRALRMLSRSNEALIRATSERDLLTEICRIAVEVGGFRLAWVGYAVDDAEKRIVPQAHAGVEDGYLSLIRLTWDDTPPTGQGPAARAIRTGKPMVVADLAEGGAGFHSVAAARARGFRGVACLPLKEEGRAFGVMALYLDEVRTMPNDEIGLLQELADDLAFGIVNLRARAERRRTHEAVLTMARGVSASIGGEFFEKLTLSMVEALGAQAGYVARLLPPDRERVGTICAVVAGRTVDNFEYSLAGTPCENLVASDFCIFPRNAQKLYPRAGGLADMGIEAYVGARLADAAGRPIGVMFVLFQQPLNQPEFVTSTLKIFAARAAAELERQDADARTREQAALIDQARDAIIVRDLEHRITFWSKGAERLYGWRAAEAEARPVPELLRVDAARFAEADRVLREKGEWNGEIQKTAKDGIVRTLDCRWTLLRTPDGDPKSILAIDTDVTERKKLEQQFLRAQRMESIGTLAGGIAHDMNNLLAPIVMGVGLLRQFTTDEQSLQVIRNIERSARRGTDLVKQVLSFARGVDGARVAIALKHVVHEVEAIAQNTFPKNITFETDAAKDLWLVTGDPTQLNQVLLNLCVNARDAMPDGGRLTVKVRNIVIDEQYAVMNRGVAAGRYVRVEVTDTGCGMPKEVSDRIFEPFFTTKEMGKGTGLGLSTVLGIVRSHGGFVNVYSEVGKGSVFKVYLPAQSDGGPAGPAEPVTRERLPRGQGELILVVDDEASVRDITQQTLEAFGYRAVTAEDGAQAIGLYALHRQEIAVVLTDMMMPVMDGPALIAALQRIDPAIRIIAASGLHANANLARVGSGGVKHFLAKPYSAETMLTLLKTVLAEKAP